MKRATWGQFESQITTGDEVKAGKGGGEVHTHTHTNRHTKDYGVKGKGGTRTGWHNTQRDGSDDQAEERKSQRRYQCDTTNEVALCCSGISALRCGHLCCCRSLRVSSHKACWNIHRSAVTIRLQVWKLAIRSKGGPLAVTLETSSGLWKYFILRCLPGSSLCDRRGSWWAEGGKD